MIAKSITNILFHLLVILSFMTLIFFICQEYSQKNINKIQSDFLYGELIINPLSKEEIKNLSTTLKINEPLRNSQNIILIQKVSKLINIIIFVCMVLITILKLKYNFNLDDIFRINTITLCFLLLTYIIFFVIIRNYIFIDENKLNI